MFALGLFVFPSNLQDGFLDRKEIEEGLAKLNIIFNSTSWQKSMARTGLAGSETLNLEQFTRLARHRADELTTLFYYMDKNHDGRLSVDEINDTFTHFKLSSDPETTKQLISWLDRDESGDVTLDEWQKLLLMAPNEQVEEILAETEGSIMMGDAEIPVPPLPEKKAKQALQHIGVGMFAGAIAKTAVAPLSRMKILFQVSDHKPSFMNVVKKIYSQGGIRAFYRGNFTNCIKAGPAMGIKLLLFDNFKAWVKDNGYSLNPVTRFLSGGLASMIAHAIVFPIEVVKMRLEATSVHEGGYRGISDCVTRTLRNEGFGAFFRGVVPQMLATFPSSGITLGFYSAAKDEMERRKGTKNLKSLDIAICSTASGLVGELATYPLHLAKTRLAVDGAPGHGERKYFGLWDCLVKTKAVNGIGGLYRGFTPTLIKHVPSVAVTMTTYEVLKTRFGISKGHGE
eukprot:TRINITY_DN300_c0_g1_i4.p1 TRINITY_DN300_c0_g1~~TRINITY_DN300_c0_g1_i4.p1  ORF type:complete len:455 (-),score=85.79 TRINITY_DN300_c0_g1_i4:53-1417(-)